MSGKQPLRIALARIPAAPLVPVNKSLLPTPLLLYFLRLHVNGIRRKMESCAHLMLLANPKKGSGGNVARGIRGNNRCAKERSGSAHAGNAKYCIEKSQEIDLSRKTFEEKISFLLCKENRV